MIRFVIFFILAFSLLVFAYLQIPDDLLRLTIYPALIVHPNIFILDITRLIEVKSLNNLIFVGDKSLEIVRGCDGSGFIFIFIAALIAYPTAWRHKFVGLLLGVVALWLINILRIACLIYLKKYFDHYFYLVHNLISPILFCAISLCIFWAWLIGTDKSSQSTSANEQ